MCGCLSCAAYWRSGLQSKHVPWPGIALVTLWFVGWHSIHWAAPARVVLNPLTPSPIPPYPAPIWQPSKYSPYPWFCLCSSLLSLFVRFNYWYICIFFHFISFCSQKLWGLVFLVLQPWAGGTSVGLRLLAPEIFLPNFYPPCVHEGPASSMSVPLLPVWMDEVFKILSLSDYHSTRFLMVLSDACCIF